MVAWEGMSVSDRLKNNELLERGNLDREGGLW